MSPPRGIINMILDVFLGIFSIRNRGLFPVLLPHCARKEGHVEDR